MAAKKRKVKTVEAAPAVEPIPETVEPEAAFEFLVVDRLTPREERAGLRQEVVETSVPIYSALRAREEITIYLRKNRGPVMIRMARHVVPIEGDKITL